MPDSTPPVNPFKKTNAAAKRASTVGIAAIVIAILAIGVAWFAWNEVHRATDAVKTYAGQVGQQTQTATKAEQATVAKLKTQLDSLQSKFGKTQDKLDQLSNVSLKAHDQRAFSEAGYLIHLANLQLTISQNPDAALQLMKLANEQLKTISNPGVTPLKNAVAKNIVALENAPKLDVTKLLGQLDQLKISVLKLPSMPTEPSKKKLSTIDDAKKADTKLPWYKKLGKSLGSLKELVIIRHDKKPIKPLLSPQQLTFLKQNVQLKISEAEWAVLYQNVATYRQSLQGAKQMLEAFYPNQEAMADTLKQIQTLSETNIKPELPDLSKTLNILSKTVLEYK